MQGAKNAALPMLAASLLATEGQTILHRLPPVKDVLVAMEVLRAPCGQSNRLPEESRGWLFFERFVSMVQVAMAEEDSAAMADEISGVHAQLHCVVQSLEEAEGEASVAGDGGAAVGQDFETALQQPVD